MLWLLFLSCIMGYQEEGNLTTLSIERTHATHHYNYSKALESSLKIICFNGQFENVGHGSGNYFKSGKYKFILTAAHVIDHKYESYIADGEELVGLIPIHVDRSRDLAILVPMRDLWNIEAQWYRVNRSNDLIGKTIYYAGFPQDLGKSLFKGFVAKDGKDKILIQSFALPGSSGSVVFDFWGRAIGVLSAVSVGISSVNPFPELVETAVHIQKIKDYDHDFIKGLFESVKK